MEDLVVDVILEQFHSLPAKYKPILRAGGHHDWVPLSGIVLTKADHDEITRAVLATGMKCLPARTVPKAGGHILHDWHAEILAIRAFNRFLIQECHDMAKSPEATSDILRRRTILETSVGRGLQPFTLHEHVKIYMYCSEAPCGDASMELTMDAQDDATPWSIPSEDASSSSDMLKGRGYFSQLGIVRRKPSRPDSPHTLSKSCSDKLSLKQCTSLLSSPTSLLISPENAYIDTLILPYPQYHQIACARAFSAEGRMKPVAGSMWPGSYNFQPFKVRTTHKEFAFSRRSTSLPPAEFKGSNISCVSAPGVQETLINGVLQGRKQLDPRGASAVCRRKMWKAVVEVIALLGVPALHMVLSHSTYASLKGDDMLKDRLHVKQAVRSQALTGWIRNAGGDFELDAG